MLWIKALHIIFMVTWFAALFYLPRLFVYHAMSDDAVSIERFKIMERKLFFGIMTPGAVLTVAFGISSFAVWLLGPLVKSIGFTHALWIMAGIAIVRSLIVLMLPDEPAPQSAPA